MDRKQVYLNFVVIAFILFFSSSVYAQLKCRTGHVNLETKNKMSTVVADNYQLAATYDINSGNVEFMGLTQSFSLESGVLDQAFNSKMVDVSGFSKFSFRGNVEPTDNVNFSMPGKYPCIITGVLYMGSYERNTTAHGTIFIGDDLKVRIVTDFSMTIEQETVNKANALIAERLSQYVTTGTLGISRDISVIASFQF